MDVASVKFDQFRKRETFPSPDAHGPAAGIWSSFSGLRSSVAAADLRPLHTAPFSPRLCLKTRPSTPIARLHLPPSPPTCIVARLLSNRGSPRSAVGRGSLSCPVVVFHSRGGGGRTTAGVNTGLSSARVTPDKAQRKAKRAGVKSIQR